ncbi:MAG: CBS domain-containing protein [Caldilineales bacterium]
MIYTVQQVMRTALWAITPQASLDEALALMREQAVRRLPVLDDDGELIGILSRGDVREALSIERAQLPSPYAPEANEKWLSVGEAMTPDPLVVTPQDSLTDAVELMLARKIGGLPVVEATQGSGRRHLVGIVTDSDILRLMLRLWRAEESEKTVIQSLN